MYLALGGERIGYIASDRRREEDYRSAPNNFRKRQRDDLFRERADGASGRYRPNNHDTDHR